LLKSVGSGVFFFFPTFSIITYLIGGETTACHSINQVSKEILYVPLDIIPKVKGKAFIDMFVLKGVKALGAAMLLVYSFWLSKIGFTSQFLMTVNICLSIIWLYAVFYVGKQFRNKTNCHLEKAFSKEKVLN